jgi:hypothetical protein
MREDEPVDFPHEPIPAAINLDVAMESMAAATASTVGLTSRVLEEGFLLTIRVGWLTPRDNPHFPRVAG